MTAALLFFAIAFVTAAQEASASSIPPISSMLVGECGCKVAACVKELTSDALSLPYGRND
jgi:hypothetical protein